MWSPGAVMRPVMVSSPTARPSLFAEVGPYAFRGSLGSASLGQTPQEWYRRAKDALAKFDGLLNRLARVANQTERENILRWVGTSAQEDTPAERYASVKSDLQTDVEAYTPPNVNAYQVVRRTRRIEKLEDFNREFEAKVSNAETVYGKLPEPVVIEREKLVQAPGAGGMNWTLPLVVGGGAVVVALALTLLGGK